MLKTADDSLSAFPRVWRKNDEAANAALLPEEDLTKSPPTTKKLGLYPSHQILVVRVPMPIIICIGHGPIDVAVVGAAWAGRTG